MKNRKGRAGGRRGERGRKRCTEREIERKIQLNILSHTIIEARKVMIRTKTGEEA